jgi:hypothetical protein
MAKSFLCRRSPAGIAVPTDAIDHFSQDVNQAEKQYGRKSLEVADPLLILSSTYYVMGDYEKAAPPLVRYVTIVKEKLGPSARETFYGLWLLSDSYTGFNRFADAYRIGQEAKSMSRSIDFSASDSLIEALMRRAGAHKGKSDLPSRQRGLVTALIALSWCMTSGFYRSPTGPHVMEGLRIFFETYGISKEEWGWIVKHAHVRRYDFVGLLSILLHHTHLAPAPVVTVVRARRRAS